MLVVRGKPSLRDPHCGNLVDPRKALRAVRGGRTHLFCCESCLRHFLEE